jgi:acetyl-CoA C-acetyltransferase
VCDESQEYVIVFAVRTPFGKFQGALSGFTAINLSAIVIREPIARAELDPALVDECLMDCVLAAGLGQNPACHAGLRAALADKFSPQRSTWCAVLV